MNNTEAEMTLSNQTPLAGGDSTKLFSLLALATGAAAMPQSSVADIVYTDLSSSPASVGWLGGGSSYTFNDLPGDVLFGLQRFQSTFTTTYFGVFTYRSRWVTAGQQGGSAAAGVRGTATYGFFPELLPFGASWSAGGGGTFTYVSMGWATTYDHEPGFGYSDQYLAWVFADTSQGGAFLYGWIQVSLAITHPSGPNVTVTGYAYDDVPGMKPLMGQVPEPSSGGLLVLGALALGARGVRKWRSTRPASDKG